MPFLIGFVVGLGMVVFLFREEIAADLRKNFMKP